MDEIRTPDNDENKSEIHQNISPLEETNGSVRTSSVIKPSLTDEDLRNACYDYIKDFYCYGDRFIRNMVLTDIQNECAFHYKLESFCEKREIAEKTTSYYGQRIDGSHNGPSPHPWEVEIKPPAWFQDYEEYTEIPHTAYKKHCEKCKWNMKVRCDNCSGKGEAHCLLCLGSGKEEGGNKCLACKGSGKEMCEKCQGKGLVECGACDGHGELVHFQVVIATWRTHSEDFITNTFNLPNGLILESEGEEINREEGEVVQPIKLDLDQEVNEGSAALISKHNILYEDEVITAQRHFLRAVPLTKATYTWRNKEGEFYVYGLERKVYFAEYPQTCGNCICC
ncbi:unnamed protein product [Larinioides sclopetarius]|uniref:Protein SSUH2 homolog n=1 Tax=Larinioides sclopetarius TaxID=280406 RepID=A0AAV1Z6V8_9ARAC